MALQLIALSFPGWVVRLRVRKIQLEKLLLPEPILLLFCHLRLFPWNILYKSKYLPQSQVHVFNKILYLFRKNVSICWTGCKNSNYSIFAGNTRHSTPIPGYTDILSPKQEEASDQAHVFHSIFTLNEGQAPETSVIPQFVYYRSDILKYSCQSDGRVLVAELVFLIQYSNFDFKIFSM